MMTRFHESRQVIDAGGKMIDDATSTPQDSYNLRLERALSNDDVRHRFSGSYILPLPFGPGQPFAKAMEGLTKSILGNWEVSGIVRANSGSPQNPTLTTNNSGTGNTGWDRPDLAGDPKLDHPSAKSWWNAAAFAIPARGQFGNAGRNILIGPGLFSMDFSVLKKFDVRETQQVQFRFEFFNLTNHPNYDTPAAKTNTSNFGTVPTAQPARQVQLGLKYLF